ncbi:4-hydroxy-tetrahydrodipicolinate synthase [Parafrankia colletiae]|uniref:4-hydroxy-tetrahydrodipicolinate synthase n=1 Tax=Parafrankia colletiae TaxID=573497 RepID=A0A1S1RBA1_9ACTN|nr:4-hydroxy-tetrahydrodipicolinate synthase [Parafrankia colletiae]MCK9898567.1 4-hydroxy-tetrahydrodipicolinate synthase [Frankia sp. Cpl3]OHV44083.1 4-hydroxy-tetrahydrodipicolinate synthase [Parafrankia colletiae]
MSEVPASVAGMSALPPAPFGRMITAMITPFTTDGGLDVPGAAALAEHLVDAGNEALVVNGTTGESPTTSDAEKDTLLRVVREAVGGRARVIAGVGTNDTRHTLELAGAAEKAGADGLLVVAPYYNKPPQAGLLAHFRAVADATCLPVMIYDIPGRSGVPVTTETLLQLADHPRIVAVKDAKDDLSASSWVLANSGLAYYSGTDVLNLPLLSVGACGVVSVVGHLAAPAIRAMIEAFGAGEVGRAITLHKGLLPAYEGVFRTQGVITTKAALAMAGLPAGPVRAPLVDATEAERARLRADLAAAVLEPAAGGSAAAPSGSAPAGPDAARPGTAAAAAGTAAS